MARHSRSELHEAEYARRYSHRLLVYALDYDLEAFLERLLNFAQ